MKFSVPFCHIFRPESAENGVLRLSNFKIFWVSMPQNPWRSLSRFMMVHRLDTLLKCAFLPTKLWMGHHWPFIYLIYCNATLQYNIGSGRGGAGGGLPPPPPHFFADGIFFYMRTPGIPNQKCCCCCWWCCCCCCCCCKVANRCRHAANIAFDLFNIFLYVITRKVRKCPLSPFVTSNVVLSCLVRMADILARLVQKEDSLSALQLTGALFTINWGTLCQTHLPPPPIHPYP